MTCVYHHRAASGSRCPQCVSPALWDDPGPWGAGGARGPEGRGMCVQTADSCYCTPETNAAL